MPSQTFDAILRVILILGMSAVGTPATAMDLEDVEDMEGVSEEADAAYAETKDVQESLAREQARVRSAYKAASDAHNAAESKRQDAISRMKSAEAEIDRLNSESARLKKDMERLAQETAAANKTSEEMKIKVEKANMDLATLKELRNEAANKFLQTTVERDRLTESVTGLEEQRLLAEQEFQKLKEQQKQAEAQLAKVKQEEAQKQARLKALIDGMKQRSLEAEQRKVALEKEAEQERMNTAKLEAQSKLAQEAVHTAESRIDRAPNQIESAGRVQKLSADMAPEELVFKRKCRVFERPARDAKVIMVQQSGTAVSRSDEGKTWFSFSLSDGRVGFAAKKCFH
ncbi:MAG: hypothetical protein AB7G93_06225 [Bdellovibrionales bacterium]